MELGPVFARAHERVFAMLEGRRDRGLRIDHIDGLFDPKAYLTALREHAGKPFYLVVEKILAPHEALRAGVAGRGDDRLRLSPIWRSAS